MVKVVFCYLFAFAVREILSPFYKGAASADPSLQPSFEGLPIRPHYLYDLKGFDEQIKELEGSMEKASSLYGQIKRFLDQVLTEQLFSPLSEEPQNVFQGSPVESPSERAYEYARGNWPESPKGSPVVSPSGTEYEYAGGMPESPKDDPQEGLYATVKESRMGEYAKEKLNKPKDYSHTTHPSFVSKLDQQITQLMRFKTEAVILHGKIIMHLDRLLNDKRATSSDHETVMKRQVAFSILVSEQLEHTLERINDFLFSSFQLVQPSVNPFEIPPTRESRISSSTEIPQSTLTYESPVQWLVLYANIGVEAIKREEFDEELFRCLANNIKSAVRNSMITNKRRGALLLDSWTTLYLILSNVAKVSIETQKSLSGFNNVQCEQGFEKDLDIALCEAYKRVYATYEREIIQNIFTIE